MRKLIWIVLAAFMVSFVSCSKCSKKEEPTTDSIKSGLVVENTISSDKQFMSDNYGEYRFYESCITLKNYLDSDTVMEIATVVNIFQIEEERKEMKGYDTKVIKFTHTPKISAIEEIKGFWVEDFPLDSVTVTFEEALEKINEVNMPKPHSKQCVLRKQVGPAPANPQYIFGNVKSQIYVDAINGNVSDENPAFPK